MLNAFFGGERREEVGISSLGRLRLSDRARKALDLRVARETVRALGLEGVKIPRHLLLDEPVVRRRGK